jgi:hypothetical protein
MALIAGIGRFQTRAVTCRLAHALPTVMAASALPRQCSSVIETGTQKSGSVEVTAIARRIGHDVTGWHRCGHNAFTQRMTPVASLRRALEYTGNVTGFTSRRGMPAGQRKACGGMIEVAPGQLRIGHRL